MTSARRRSQSARDSTQPLGVGDLISELVPDALYHVRMVATNTAGTTIGPDHDVHDGQGPGPAPPVLGQRDRSRAAANVWC